jgi:CRP/FNR family cyclic AMP-dependent transcriptional regulator
VVPMKSSVRPNEEAFDPQAFLAKVADGQTLIDYSDRQTVFAQGDCADSIFYIHKGKVKVAVLSN